MRPHRDRLRRHLPRPPRAAPVVRGGADQAAARWGEIVPALKPLVRAIYSVPKVLGVRDGALTLGAPNDAHRTKCEQHRAEVERRRCRGRRRARARGDRHRCVRQARGSRRPRPADDPRDQRDTRGPADGSRGGPTYGLDAGPSATVVALHPSGPPPADEDIDLNDLVDAPPDSVVSPIDRLAQAFPGSELMDERH